MQAAGWSPELKKWENEIEMGWVREMHSGCKGEVEESERRIQEKRGFFGIGADWDEVRR